MGGTPAGRGRAGPPRPSKAWLLYAGLAVVCGVLIFTTPGTGKLGPLLGVALFGLYARYLYRGGRFVLVPLPGCLFAALALVVSASGFGWMAWRWLG